MLNVPSRRLYHEYTNLIIVAVGMAMISIANLDSGPWAVFAEEEHHKFTAKLTGSEEVPPKTTKATGTSEFILEQDPKLQNKRKRHTQRYDR